PLINTFNYKDGRKGIQQVFFALADQYAIENAPSADGDYITEKKWMTEKELEKLIERPNIVTTFKDAIKHF
ncbi:MAG: hypothetical protein GOV15_00120, partial [Candidatus Diapherotrites archaeon]|nr:hypothetical protein [Candidatus Diapherotrites archaeon]